MTTIRENRKIMQALAWFIAACVIIAALTSCSPYAAQIATGTPTAAPSVTATVLQLHDGTATTTPRPSCTVTGTVYLRPSASRAGEPLDVLRAGRVLAVIERGDWLKVETAQRVTGWVYGRYCR